LNELDGNQIIISIPRSTIVSVSLSYGEGVERPIRQIIIGVILCLLGLVIANALRGLFSHEVPGEYVGA
jgi:hypothetical protein